MMKILPKLFQVVLLLLLSEIHAETEQSTKNQTTTLMKNVTNPRSPQVNQCTVDKSMPAETDPEHRLMSDLMKNYNLNARPVHDKTKPVEILFDLAFNQIVELDGRRQTLRSKVWLRQFWKNPYLTWNSSDYCDLKTVIVNSKNIWKPDVVLYNSIGQEAAIYNRNYMIKVHSDGQTEWLLPAEISSICQIDIKNFPFDSQQCILKFGSWAYTSIEVNLILKNNSADMAAFTPNGEWELVSMPAKRNSITYTCCPNPYVDITYTIHIKRRVLFYLNNLIIPCIILAALTTLSFYLPPESGERVSLVITLLLGLTVFMLLYNESIPPTSESMPLIGKYFFAILVEVTSALVITCFTMRCYHHNPFKEMPGWFRYLIFTVLAPILRMEFPKRTQKIEELRRPSQTRLLPHNKHIYTTTSLPNGTGKYPPWNGNNQLSSRSSHQSLEKVSMDLNDEKLDCISQQVDILLDYFDNEQKVDVKRDEWHFASIVLDQVFFYMFTITIVFSVITFYTMIPA